MRHASAAARERGDARADECAVVARLAGGGRRDEVGAGLAGGAVLLAGAAAAADGADELTAFDQRNAAFGADDAVQRQDIGMPAVDGVLEQLGGAAELGGGA